MTERLSRERHHFSIVLVLVDCGVWLPERQGKKNTDEFTGDHFTERGCPHPTRTLTCRIVAWSAELKTRFFALVEKA